MRANPAWQGSGDPLYLSSVIKKLLLRLLPRPFLTRIHRTLRYGPSDLFDTLAGRREPMVPPKRKIFIGGPLFKEIGDEHLRIFMEVGGIRSDDAVLDVGCGIGRSARPLTAFLSARGRYEGFDIDADGIAWCRKHITSRFPNFRFQIADVYNKYYHPKGRFRGEEYRFPYEDSSFDFVFLNSVFTHMLPAETDNYLHQIARVLKPGGRCLASWFLWNPESQGLKAAGKGNIEFPHGFGVYRVRDKDFPEDAVSFSEDHVLELHKQRGLAVQAPIHYGTWCGRDKGLSYQDYILAVKDSQ